MKTTKWGKTHLLFIIFTIIGVEIQAEDWPSWRGPYKNGISYEKEWQPSALNRAKVLWRINVGKGHSSCSVKGNYMVTMGNKEKEINGKKSFYDTVYCIDVKSGEEIWKYSYPAKDRPYPGPRTTPTIDENRVYTLGSEGDLFCFDIEEGDILWKRHLVKEGFSKIPKWGFSGSPVVIGNKLILTAGENGVCFNKLNGTTVWKGGAGTAELPSPLPVKYKGEDVVLLPDGDKLSAFNPENGKRLWHQPWKRGLSVEPAHFNGRIFIPDNRGFNLLDINGKPTVLSKKRIGFITFQNFILYKNHAFGFTRKGKLFSLVCFNPESNSLKWSQPIPEWGSISIVDNKLIILQGNGKVVIGESSSKAWKELASARILKIPDNRNLQRPRQCHCWTMPILANGRLYVRSNYGEVACIDMRISKT